MHLTSFFQHTLFTLSFCQQLSVGLRRYHMYYVIHITITAAAISSLGSSTRTPTLSTHPIDTPYYQHTLSTYQHTLSTHPHFPHTIPLLTLQHLLSQVSSHSVLICKIPLPEPPSTSSSSSFSSHSKDLSKPNYLLSHIPHGWIIVYKHIFSRW